MTLNRNIKSPLNGCFSADNLIGRMSQNGPEPAVGGPGKEASSLWLSDNACPIASELMHKRVLALPCARRLPHRRERSRSSRTVATISSVLTLSFTPGTSKGDDFDRGAGDKRNTAPSRLRISTAPSRSASSSTEAKFSRASEYVYAFMWSSPLKPRGLSFVPAHSRRCPG
jgi:hypothetical protein